MSKEFYELVRAYGLSIDYTALTETDFTAPTGTPYTPPEKGGYRRIAATRAIQLLSDASGVIETFQTSTVELRLPANTVSDSTNDAGDGRLFFLKNSGTGEVVIKDYLGNTLWTVRQYGMVQVVGNDNDNWDFYFKAQNIDFDSPGFSANNVRDAIAEAKQNAEGFPRAGARSTYNGTVSNNNWLGPNELLPNTPLLVLPVNIKLNEITWANSNTNVQFRIEFRRGSRTGPIFYTLTVTPPNPGYGFVTGLSAVFSPGETIHAQYKDDGKNTADMDLILWISRIPGV